MIVVWTDTMTPLHSVTSVYYLLAPLVRCRYIELDLYRNMIMVMMMMTMISGNLDCMFRPIILLPSQEQERGVTAGVGVSHSDDPYSGDWSIDLFLWRTPNGELWFPRVYLLLAQ